MNKLELAFGQIHAGDDLKRHTEEFLYRRTHGYAEKKAPRVRRLAAVGAVCAALLCFGLFGGWLFFTPVSAISIDINPSLELGVNRFGRVVAVEPFNEDGRALTETLDLRFIDYTTALNVLLEDDRVQCYLKRNESMSIVVICDNEEESGKMLAAVRNCAGHRGNIHCHAENSSCSADAHAAGLSCGKYRAFLELRELDPSVTEEDVRNMTMREIRERIFALSGKPAQCAGEGHHGHGKTHE